MLSPSLCFNCCDYIFSRLRYCLYGKYAVFISNSKFQISWNQALILHKHTHTERLYFQCHDDFVRCFSLRFSTITSILFTSAKQLQLLCVISFSYLWNHMKENRNVARCCHLILSSNVLCHLKTPKMRLDLNTLHWIHLK